MICLNPHLSDIFFKSQWATLFSPTGSWLFSWFSFLLTHWDLNDFLSKLPDAGDPFFFFKTVDDSKKASEFLLVLLMMSSALDSRSGFEVVSHFLK